MHENSHCKVRSKKWAFYSDRKLFLTESLMLRSLNSDFECICKKTREHFPKIIYSDKKNLCNVFSYCGKSLNFIRKMEEVEDLDCQLDCIVYNLNKKKIHHNDMYNENLCLNKSGDIVVIDFDMSIEGGNNTSHCYNMFKEKMRAIVNNAVN